MIRLISALLLLGLLQSCTLQNVNDTASTARLKHAVEVSRERSLVISPLNHVGLYINTERATQAQDNIDNPLLPVRLEQLQEGISHAVFQEFVEMSQLRNARSFNRNIDFIIEAYILKMTLAEKTVKESTVSALDSGKTQRQEVLIPVDYLDMKLLLKDARSDQVIDIAYISARSGQFDYYKGYASFASHAIEEYLKTITQ